MIIENWKSKTKLIYLFILIFVSISVNGQEKLKIGATKLSSKPLKVDSYNCIITPTISAQSSNKLSLSFKLEWFDKNNSKISTPEKVSVIFKYKGNVDDYCAKNKKKLSAKSGLFTKNKELPNSISILPDGVLEVAPYSNIILGEVNPPVNMKVLNETSLPLTLKLLLYEGRVKGNSLSIDDDLNELSWKFILPSKASNDAAASKEEQKSNDLPTDISSEDLSCEDLETKYNSIFKESQPKLNIGYFESRQLEIESGQLPAEKLFELKNGLFEFKMNISSLTNLKEKIRSDPNYDNCFELKALSVSINSYLTDTERIDVIIEKIDNAIIESGGSSGGGGAEGVPTEEFMLNVQFSMEKYELLSNIEMDPELQQSYGNEYLYDLYAQLKEKKLIQDSLYKIIIGSEDIQLYKKENKKFNEYYRAAIGIIEDIYPDVIERQKSKSEMTGGTADKKSGLLSKTRSFPIGWIIFPLLVLILGFGVYRYLAYIKKGKKIKK